MQRPPKPTRQKLTSTTHSARWQFWGKTAGEGSLIHPLVDHCIDVAQTLRQILRGRAFELRVRRATANQLPLSEAQFDRLAVLALLHDIGKCNTGFQSKRDPAARDTAGHVLEASAFLLNDNVQALWPKSMHVLAEDLCGWFCGGEEQAMSMLLAAISHHGRPVSFHDLENSADRNLARWWRPRDAIDPMRGIDELIAATRSAFPSAFTTDVPPIDATPALQARFAGLVMLADWVGSDTAFFPYRANPAQDRAAYAAQQARRAVTGIGLTRDLPPPETTFSQTFGFPASPLQNMLAKELPIDDGSRLVLVESETGSGKTEAALAWFLRLLSAGESEGLYFALPTRVAARELYGRVVRAVERAFPDPQQRPGPVLLAAPGYARVDGMVPVLPVAEGRLWEDNAELRRHERQWASAHPKRFLAAPVAVGTIDQALLSVLQVKHALLRSVCLDRSLLVVDEVHASDPYMRQALQSLLAGHRARGGRALLLSATLGESAASQFFGRQRLSLALSQRRPYPSVSREAGEHPIPARGELKQVRVSFTSGIEDADVLPQIVAALNAGARVLAVCNTVARANSLLRAIEAQPAVPRSTFFSVAGQVCPHHGRFSREHREVMDAAVSKALGKGSPAGALLLVGTQTLEQSLDIDADLLISDVCPMDVLLQRIGRLHRHRREGRPAAHSTPILLLRTPADADLRRWLRADGRLLAPAGLGTVYPDGRALQRTLDLLRDRALIEIPTDNRRLIEETTHPDALASLPPEWRAHGHYVEGAEMAQIRAALTSAIQDLPFGELHYAAPDERVVTRLGASNLDLTLAQPVSHPFDTLMRSVGIPAHMSPRPGSCPDVIDVEPHEDGIRFSLGERRFRYTRYGLEYDDA